MSGENHNKHKYKLHMLLGPLWFPNMHTCSIPKKNSGWFKHQAEQTQLGKQHNTAFSGNFANGGGKVQSCNGSGGSARTESRLVVPWAVTSRGQAPSAPARAGAPPPAAEEALGLPCCSSGTGAVAPAGLRTGEGPRGECNSWPNTWDLPVGLAQRTHPRAHGRTHTCTYTPTCAHAHVHNHRHTETQTCRHAHTHPPPTHPAPTRTHARTHTYVDTLAKCLSAEQVSGTGSICTQHIVNSRHFF